MRRFLVLVNPISGGGRAPGRAAAVAALLREAGAEVRLVDTEGPEHAATAAREAAEAGVVAIAAGGDGLARDVAGGAACVEGAEIGILPAGRGNDLARKLGVPDRAGALARLFLTGQARPVDALECGETVIPGNLYAGLDSVANAMINASRWMPAKLLYRFAPIRAIATWKPVAYRLVLDGEPLAFRGHTVVVGNSGTYGHGLDIVPAAAVDDGVFDVLLAGDMPRWKVASLMREAAQGTHLRRPEMAVRRAREITIDADRPLPVCADGDYLCDLPVTVRLRPAALRVLRP